MGHIHFKKLTKCQKFIEIFHYCLTRLRNKKQGFFWLYLLIRTTLRKENTRQHNFKKHFKFCNFNEIFFVWHEQTQKHEFECFYTMSTHKNHFKKQSLFKKHSKFQNFDETFYCAMNRLRNTNLDVFIQYQYTRTIVRNENVEQSLFKKHSKFQKFDEINCRMTRFRNVKLDVFR